MTSFIPAPFSNNPVSPGGSQNDAQIGALASSIGTPTQGDPDNAGAQANFESLLNPAAGAGTPLATNVAVPSPSQAASDPAAVSQPGVRIKDLSSDAGSGAPEETGQVTGIRGLRRDLAETIAAILSPFWTPMPQPAPLSGGTQANGGSLGATGAGPSEKADAGSVLPEAAAMGFPTDPWGGSAQVQGIYGKIAATIKAGTVEAPSLGSAMPSTANVPGQTPAGQSAAPIAVGLTAQLAVAADSGAEQSLAPYMEKIAAGPSGGPVAPARADGGAKKNFLMSSSQKVKGGSGPDGIGIAETSANMASSYSNSRPMAGPTADTIADAAAGGTLSGASVGQALSSPVTPSLAPVLAQRAVETVLNVVDAQQTTAGQGGIVKLDFNFGGEALAVHVQMRGGEVHTEFRTNSPELRSALSSEWHAAAGQRDPEGVRLVEPVFASSESGTSTANGSSSNGEYLPQKQNPQQEQQSQDGGQLESFRASRASALRLVQDESTGSPSSPVIPSTSLHLAAVA